LAIIYVTSTNRIFGGKKCTVPQDIFELSFCFPYHRRNQTLFKSINVDKDLLQR